MLINMIKTLKTQWWFKIGLFKEGRCSLVRKRFIFLVWDICLTAIKYQVIVASSIIPRFQVKIAKLYAFYYN